MVAHSVTYNLLYILFSFVVSLLKEMIISWDPSSHPTPTPRKEVKALTSSTQIGFWLAKSSVLSPPAEERRKAKEGSQ